MPRASGNALEKRRSQECSAGCFRGAAHPGPHVRTTESGNRDWQMTLVCNPHRWERLVQTLEGSVCAVLLLWLVGHKLLVAGAG
jgi:hypothetical protein